MELSLGSYETRISTVSEDDVLVVGHVAGTL
jgi:hypothetical protein